MIDCGMDWNIERKCKHKAGEFVVDPGLGRRCWAEERTRDASSLAKINPLQVQKVLLSLLSLYNPSYTEYDPSTTYYLRGHDSSVLYNGHLSRDKSILPPAPVCVFFPPHRGIAAFSVFVAACYWLFFFSSSRF